MARRVKLNTGDIEIGAVELKDAATDSRASIEAANTARTTATKVVAVQHVDATGAVLPAVPVLGAGEAHLGEVGGKKVYTSHEYTMPSSGASHTAKDAIADSTSAPTLMTFASAGRANGKSGYIVGARLNTDQKTNVARFRLHLYHTAPTAINDDSPYLLLYADKAKRIGAIDFPACATEDPTNSTMASSMNMFDRIPFKCAANDTSIYGILETLDTFTSANSQKIFVELCIEQD